MKIKNFFYIIIIFSSIILTAVTTSNASNNQVKHFVMSNVSNFYGTSDIMSNTLYTFSKLGYNNCSNGGSGGYETADIYAVNNYIHLSGNNYALSFLGHGTNVSGTLQINDGNMALTPASVSGNWHLVLLNSCSGGATSAFADAFHITGYSNRGFVGWSSTITNIALLEWGPKFNAYLGTMSVRMAHKTAAEKCQNSTPARFFGDTSWYGWAW